MSTVYPTFHDHQHAWEELARGIASLKHQVREIEPDAVVPNSQKGELIIIGTGIETIGISVGDQKLLEEADKVLFCVADPATIVWLKKLRPDALDLYVLYGENKVRYTTYMQMTEAQLYWVRQGLKVVVAFYGHPGVFVLSTHRAIKIARREGYKATMKAGVCALDTLCADLGVDPCHPGLQTHEATDCLMRQRTIDPSLHVILWQVGLIGELGYRRHGYLNNNFSYFINWLQKIYGKDYTIQHYIGSRYPSIDPLVEFYQLSQLHDPENQAKITGLSTFYIPPRDVIPTHQATALELGLIHEGQKLVTPKSPLREIGQYGPREMKAFTAFEQFRIPPSYKWQTDTQASEFLIALRFDTALQDLYRRDPLTALDDPRFAKLSDRERAMLASRDSGAIQVAAKGVYLRSTETEKSLINLLTRKSSAVGLLKAIANQPRSKARASFSQWLAKHHHEIHWEYLHSSIDYIHRNNVFPWTGVYIEPKAQIAITIVGNESDRGKSVIYVNDTHIKHFSFENGTIKWKASKETPFSGFLRLDVDTDGKRRAIGKILNGTHQNSIDNNFVAYDSDPEREHLLPVTSQFVNANDLNAICGDYAIRTTGRFSRDVNSFTISTSGLYINQKPVAEFSYDNGTLAWKGGEKACYAGQLNLIRDPIINSIEVYGHAFSQEEEGTFKCYGAEVRPALPEYAGPTIPDWAKPYLAKIAHQNSCKGGLLLWHKWEKSHFASKVLNKYVANLI